VDLLKLKDNKAPHILLFGINYSPEPTGSAPYTAGVAEVMVEFGFTVEAVVGFPHYPSWSLDKSNRLRLRYRENINGVNVRHFRHFIPKNQSALGRAMWELTYLFNSIFSLPRKRPNLIFATMPNLGSGILGFLYSRFFRVPFILLIQDLVAEGVKQTDLTSQRLLQLFISKLEARLHRSANLNLIVSQSFGPILAKNKVGADRIVFFRNWSLIEKSRHSCIEAREILGLNPNHFIVLHSGNMGMKQDLSNLIKAARCLDLDSEIRIILCGDGNQKESLIAQANNLQNVTFMNTVSLETLPDLLASADILIVNQSPSVSDMSLPSKLTAYFTSGRAILAAVSENSACAKEIHNSSGAGLVVPAGSPENLASAVKMLKDNPDKIKKMSHAAAVYGASTLSRQAAKDKLHSILSKYL